MWCDGEASSCITVEEMTTMWRDGEALTATAMASAGSADGGAPASVSDR
jgi:hypothetical protein